MNKIINKELNFKCFCNGWLSRNTKLVLILPCEHIFHKKCIEHKKICPICNVNIISFFYKTSSINSLQDYQRYIDLLCVSNFDNQTTYNIPSVIDNSYDLISALIFALSMTNKQSANKMLDNLLSLNYTNVYIKGMSKINKNTPHVLIANHTSYLDAMMIFRYFDTSFLSSNSWKKTFLGKFLPDFIKLMNIDRGVKRNYNIVDEMRNYVKKYKSICLFPEGAITHPKTLAQFRTGAFHIGYPIYCIVIRYENSNSDFNPLKTLFKMCRRERVDIYIDVIGPYYPPFTPEKIQLIRKKMAKTGNFFLSRVSTRNVKD